MLSLTSTGTELRRFRRGLLPRVAVAAMLLIPLLYGALYLWAFWDPTGNMDRLPVALVNADQPAQADGKTLEAGADVTKRLLDSGDLDWSVTNAKDAAAGVADGTYYFALTIPAEFSTKISSAGGQAPTAAELMVTYNDANSFLASTLGRQAMAQVRTAVSETVSEQAVDTLLVGLGSARDGFAQASDGALTLRAASGQVADGATQVATGAATLATGASKAATGAASLASGAKRLASGADTLSTGAGSVAQGAASAASSSTALAAGTHDVAAGVDTAVAKIGTLTTGLPALSDGLTSIGQYLGAKAAGGDAQAGALLAGLQHATTTLPSASDVTKITTDLGALSTGAHAAADGAGQLSAGLEKLSAGASQVSGGATTLATGTATLASGAGDLATGTSALATGSSDLATGASSLADGTGQLTTGTQTLADALKDGTAKIPDDSADLQTQRATVISAPVSVASTDVAKAEGFGEGFAPFFIPLALFVGALITWLLMRPVPPRALATPASGWRTTLTGFLPALTIGVGQVVIMLAVIHFGVGLQYASVAGTVAFTLLIVSAFLALQQMLNAVFGSAAGKVMILALLMLQLASSGGTYPVETTPQFFRVIHPLLPMSYAVSGLREVITGGADGRLWIAVLYLGALLVASLAITAWRSGRMRTWTLSRLHPVLEI